MIDQDDCNQTMAALSARLNGLVGPLLCIGNCLAPRYPSGTFVWIDPNREPKDGDVFVFTFPPSWVEQTKAMHGITVTGGMKYFRVIDGVRYLDSAEGLMPLSDDVVIEGTVVAHFRFDHPPADVARLIEQETTNSYAALRNARA